MTGAIDKNKLNDAVEQITLSAQKIGNELGYGFPLEVYEKALVKELQKAGLKVELRKKFPVTYQGEIIGEFIADGVVEGCLLIELFSEVNLNEGVSTQCLNRLRMAGFRLGMIINMGPSRVELKRISNIL